MESLNTTSPCVYKFTVSDLPDQWSHKDEKDTLSRMLKSKWDHIHNNTDIFRYKVGLLQERIVDNKFLLQLNRNRAFKRRYPERINHICEPFDAEKFNFTKVLPQEVLFEVSGEDRLDLHKILVNVSPISRFHSLLCPSINNLLPQILTQSSIKIALEVMFICQDRDLRIGFNSLCALASVNHLHFHMLYERRILPVEIVKCVHLQGPLYCFDNSYPIPALCLEVNHKNSIEMVSKQAYKIIYLLLEEKIAHNLVITRGLSLDGNGDEVVRLLIWPRLSSYGVKQFTAFNVALCELSGWFPVYNAEDFTALETNVIENELKRWQIDNFDGLCNKLKALF